MSRSAPDAVRFGDRLLAEAVRALERDGAKPLAEPHADTEARRSGGDFESRVTARARALSVAPEATSALRQTGRTIGLIVAVGAALAAVAGASAAKASLAAPDGQVNVFWALGGLLGIQTLLLLLWVVMAVRGPSALAGASLGGAAVALGRRLASRWQRGAVGATAVEAVAATFARGAIGRWSLSAVSHGLWATFNVACLVLILILLSVRHYTFAWETTILSAGAYERLTGTLAVVPRALGFPAPSREQIAAAEAPLDPAAAEQARTEWSGFLVGSLVCYGLAPRLLLLLLSLGRLRAAARRFRLDLDRPGYLRLRPALLPRSEAIGVIDGEGAGAEAVPPAAREAHGPTRPRAGGPAVMGLEIERPASPWPPPAPGVTWRDLGFVDGRDDRRRVLEDLTAGETGPPLLVVVCGLTTTPDRGIGAFMEAVREASGAPLGAILSGGEALRRRGDGELVAARVGDWRALLERVGVDRDHIVELDLEHVTDASAQRLAAAVGAGGGDAPPAGGRHLEDAFDLIVEHAGRWRGAPDARAQAKLHEAIAALYRSKLPGWRSLLRLPSALSGDPTAPLRSGAERVVGLLPQRLRADSRWVASGALAGALGCVAAAAVAPAALAGLPGWSALGAAIAAAVRAGHGGAKPVPDEGELPGGRADAVRAAALFALLLELQGRDEAAITRLLDGALADAEPLEEPAADAAVRSWLDGLRHRLDVALAGEGRP